MRKITIRLAALALGISIGAACFVGTAEAVSDKVKIKVAAQATSGQVFQYMAKDKGYLDDEGIDVEMVYINNGMDAFSALSSGKVDVLSTYGG